MNILQRLAASAVVISAWIVMGVFIEHFELSRGWSTFCGFAFAYCWLLIQGYS